MRKMLTALASCAAVLTGASTAHADSFTPVGTFTFSGPVVYTDGFSLTCTLSLLVASLSGGTDAAVVSANFAGPGFCSSIMPSALPWNIDVVSPAPPPTGVAATRIAIRGMRTSLGRTCGPGSVVANWNAGPAATISFPSGTQITPPAPGCGLVGTLTQTSGPPMVITN